MGVIKVARRRRTRRSREGTFTFYNPRTKTWFRARRLRSGRVRIIGKARGR